MRLEIVKMYFESPLHLARGRADYSSSEQRLHSDTLKSAIFSAARMFDEDDVLKGQTKQESPFLSAFAVSSAFPFFGAEYFFPRPMLDLPEAGDAEPKERKKIRYIGKSLFEKLLRGDPFPVNKANLWQENQYLSAEAIYPVTPGKPPTLREIRNFRLIHQEVFQHVMVPREGGEDSETFYMERLRFVPGNGLFFIIQFDEKRFNGIRNKVESALRLLGDEGLGSDRSTGNGQFRFDGIESLELQTPADDASHRMNLSLFCPEPAEFTPDLIKRGAYQLRRRGGYVAAPADYKFATLRKKPVYFFEEGSVFPARHFSGKLMNVRPSAMVYEDPENKESHPVWRDGTSIFIPAPQPDIRHE